MHGKRNRRDTREESGTAAKRQAGGHRLQLVFTPDVRHLLDRLKEVSEAESYSELVRRSLIALEYFFPIEEHDKEKVVPLPLASAPKAVGCTERMQVVLPERTMARLEVMKDRMKKETGSGSYSEVIRQALMVYAQLNRDLGKLGTAKLKDHGKEDENDRVDGTSSDRKVGRDDRIACLV